MSRFTFLPKIFFFVFASMWFVLIRHWGLNEKIFCLFIFALLLYIFRRATIPYRDTLKNDGEIYLSPVHGIIQSIRRDTTTWDDLPVSHEIRISISHLDEKGLYLPTAGEVSYLRANRGQKILRTAESKEFYVPMGELAHTDFVLTSKNLAKSLMRFIECPYGIRPTIWLKSGDRGRGGACFGHYTFGGTLIIYLPANCDILVFEKERVVPGQTVLAALRD
jgi:hypothetical protein